MGLRDMKLPSSTVEVPGCGSFAVRGLSVTEIEGLMNEHGAEMRAAFDALTTRKDNAEIASTVSTLVTKMPRLAAHVIAVAADDPEGVEFASRLPILAQLKAIDVIGGLTFGVEGGLKKYIVDGLEKMGGLEGVTQIMQRVAAKA